MKNLFCQEKKEKIKIKWICIIRIKENIKIFSPCLTENFELHNL